MNSARVFFELEQARKRLNYYVRLKERMPKNKPTAKWVEIFEERVQRLERQAHKLGLKTRIDAAHAKAASKSR